MKWPQDRSQKHTQGNQAAEQPSAHAREIILMTSEVLVRTSRRNSWTYLRLQGEQREPEEDAQRDQSDVAGMSLFISKAMSKYCAYRA